MRKRETRTEDSWVYFDLKRLKWKEKLKKELGRFKKRLLSALQCKIKGSVQLNRKRKGEGRIERDSNCRGGEVKERE